MSLTDEEIARRGLRGTASVTFASASLAFALLGGTPTPGPLSANKAPVFEIIEVSAGKPHTTKIFTWMDKENQFQTRTPLGKRLLSIRNRAIEKGMQLLDTDGIVLEVSERRGEVIDV